MKESSDVKQGLGQPCLSVLLQKNEYFPRKRPGNGLSHQIKLEIFAVFYIK